MAKVTLRAEDGEALIARGQLSNVPRADAETVAWVIRRYFHRAFALQEAHSSTQRLRSWLFGQTPAPSPWPEASLAASPADGDAASVCAVRDADAEPEATSHPGPPGESQRPAGAKAKGGHRPGTGRLGAAASAGGPRIEGRHEELAVGQRGPVCGQGNRSALPAGVAMRMDGQALLSAMRYALEKLRGSACGETFTAGLPAGVRDEKDSPQARAVSRCSLGVPG
jgi:hypothetical protein